MELHDQAEAVAEIVAVIVRGILSLRLRLSPQSRMDKAPKTQAAATLSYYEQMALEGDDGDGDPDRDRP